ncbi:MAG: PD40 domain-containing protein [Bacteroidales bacterium]|nr:PD40 domain-containing protein [Bacteroidales bacterium]
MRSFILLTLICLFSSTVSYSQKIDYSIVSVPEESAVEFMKVTSSNDYVAMPVVKRTKKSVNWSSNRIVECAKDNRYIAYLSLRNNTTNIFIKELGKQGGSVQRTNRNGVVDFSYSPDGKYICFSEQRGDKCQIFQTDAKEGYICRQITSANNDYTPVYSADMKTIFFSRQETASHSIWGYSIDNNFLSSYTSGITPCIVEKENAYLCARINSSGNSEIWKVNYETGVEECIVSDINRSFTTPSISPDGKWIVFVGSSAINTGKSNYYNTDIFVCRLDGSEFAQLTYHAADDLSPAWSHDGKFIYFISQRGDADGVANIWRMNFIY